MKKKHLVVKTKTLGILSDTQMQNLKGGCTGFSCDTGAGNLNTGDPPPADSTDPGCPGRTD